MTSRGVFLLAPPQHIVFASAERYRSPLTINLDRACDLLRTIEIGAVAQFSSTRLIFPSIAFSVSLSENVVWQCPPPDGVLRLPTEQLQTLRAITKGVLAQRGHDGQVSLLPALLDLPATSPLSAEQSTLLNQLLALRPAKQAGDDSAWLTGLTGLLGQGRGLTPSGDDVIIGWLVLLARSSQVNSLAEGGNMLKHVAAQLVTEAYQKTTSISANLIECAADGQGDERLIAVADGIATGSTSIAQCVEDVLSWGSSSGIEALAGMAIAL